MLDGSAGTRGEIYDTLYLWSSFEQFTIDLLVEWLAGKSFLGSRRKFEVRDSALAIGIIHINSIILIR